MYYPERDAYLRDMSDACGSAQESVLIEISDNICKFKQALNELVDSKTYNLVCGLLEKCLP